MSAARAAGGTAARRARARIGGISQRVMIAPLVGIRGFSATRRVGAIGVPRDNPEVGRVMPRQFSLSGGNAMEPEKQSATQEARKKAFSLFEEFKNFAFKGNVIDLAVGVIIGAAFG